MSIFLQSLKAKGLGASDFASWGTCEPVLWLTFGEGWLAKAGAQRPPASCSDEERVQGGPTVFAVWIL